MSSLRQVLNEVSDEQLETTYKLWLLDDDENSRQTQNSKTKKRFDVLLLRMRSAIATRFMWTQLKEEEQQILQRITAPSYRYGTPANKLQNLSKLTPPRYEQGLKSLIEHAFIQYSDAEINSSVIHGEKVVHDFMMISTFPDSVDVLYQVSREYYTPSGDRSKWNLKRLLTSLPANALVQLRKTYDLQQQPSNYFYQYESADIIAQNMLALAEPLKHLPKITDKARELFTWLRKQKGPAILQHVQEMLKVKKPEMLDIVEELSEYGLVFDTFTKGAHVVFIPVDLFETMNSLIAGKEPKKMPKREFEGEPAAVRASTYTMIYDIATLVNSIYQQTIEPTQAGKVPKRIAVKLRPRLHGRPRQNFQDGDPYLDMLLSIMDALEIISTTEPQSSDEKPAYEVTSEIDTWMHESLLRQVHALASIWIDNFEWIDAHSLDYTRPAAYTWNLTTGRKLLLQKLHTFKPDRWYSVDALLQELWQDDQKAPRTPQPYAPKDFQRKDTWERWERGEGYAYGGMLGTTLNELGMVDVGYADVNALSSSEFVNPDYFLLTGFGSEVIKHSPSENETVNMEEQAPTHDLIIQPNFELLLLQIDLLTLYSLLPFTQVQQVDLVSRLVLTKASVLRGLQSGKSLDYILRTLQEHSQREIPQNVDYTIRDWTKGFKSAGISQVLLFEVSSEEAGHILTSLPSLQTNTIRQLTPLIFAVSGDVELQKVRKELFKAELFVRVNGHVWSRPRDYFREYSSIYGRY